MSRTGTSLVTGGAGFLGSHLYDHLLSQGQRVICVDNLETGNLANIAHIRGGADFRFLHLDITAYYEVDEPVDFIYHMASPASPIDYARLPLHTLKVGAYGTHNSLGLATAKRARFLLASTSEVYGDPLIHPEREGRPSWDCSAPQDGETGSAQIAFTLRRQALGMGSSSTADATQVLPPRTGHDSISTTSPGGDAPGDPPRISAAPPRRT